MASLNQLQHLQIPLKDIESATNNFSDENLIRKTGSGYEYKGELSHSEGPRKVVVKQLDGQHDFLTEIAVLHDHKHENLVTLVGFCDESGRKIIVYEDQVHGSLDNHLSSPMLTWIQRLQICVGAARGLRHLHNDAGSGTTVLHLDIKSANILLDENLEAKISGFDILVINPANHLIQVHGYGALGYADPVFLETGTVTDRSDVYSFGVVLFEVLFARLAYKNYEDGYPLLAQLGRSFYEEGKLEEIIDPNLRKQMDPNSLTVFSKVAYQCLEQERWKRPDMDQVVKRLEKALEFQRQFEKPAESRRLKKLEHLRIPLEEIRSATSDFDEKNCIGKGGYGTIYKAELVHFDYTSSIQQSVAGVPKKGLSNQPRRSSTVAIKRLVHSMTGQGEQEFLTEIAMLSRCKHPNLVSLLGFCDDGDEMILVYEYAVNGSLDKYLRRDGNSFSLSWVQRLQICLDAARGLNHLHTGVGEQHRIIHRDVKSSNILLGQNWEAKISDFGLSRIGPSNQEATFLITNVAGTYGYCDPEYHKTRRLTKESDVYSFGVVLFEVLCGRLVWVASEDIEQRFLPNLARHCFEQGKLLDIIDVNLKEEKEHTGADADSLNTFSSIAYRCLRENQAERPTMADVIRELENALKLQVRGIDVLKISLASIKSATNDFGHENILGSFGFGRVYKGKLSHSGGSSTVVVRRLDGTSRQGELEFRTEIQILYNYKHENVIRFLGFCDEDGEMIVVYEHALHGSLDKYLNNVDLTWIKRLKICIGAARGLDYLHRGVELQYGVIHRDVKSSIILLNHDWEAKLSGFGVSRISPINQHKEFGIAGTLGYMDPVYLRTGILTMKSDVYSFGVVLFEALCARRAIDSCYKDERRFLTSLVKLCFKHKNLDDIIYSDIKEQTELKSLNTFRTIAYQCLAENQEERPTMAQVVEELEKALEFQEDWECEKKLPTNYEEILKLLKYRVIYSTKKELCYLLSSGVLLQEGKVWFSLRMDGVSSEMISATEFSYKNQKFKKWRSIRKSRFSKAAKMLDISNLSIQIKIKAKFLSPGVIYGTYIIFKFCEQRRNRSGPVYVNLKYKMGSKSLHAYFAEWRDDEWMMIELYRFTNHEKTTDFEVLLESLSRYHCGSGAIFLEGIEFRAIDNMEHKEEMKVEKGGEKSDANGDRQRELPIDYQEIIKRSENLVQSTTEEELYIFLSEGILIDKGEKFFWLSKANGKKCHLLPAKAVLYDSSNLRCFNLKPLAISRFTEVVELQSCHVFRIRCSIETQLLSPNTAYACYLVYKLSENCRGLDCPVKAKDLVHPRKKKDTVSEHDQLPQKDKKRTKIVYFRSPSQVNLQKYTRVPEQREDGWMEVLVWEFFSDVHHTDDSLPMDLKLICFEGNMSGLIVCGVEFRPLFNINQEIVPISNSQEESKPPSHGPYRGK